MNDEASSFYFAQVRCSVSPEDPIEPRNFDGITDMSVKSIRTYPPDGFCLRFGEPLIVRGFAWSGHANVVFVVLSADGCRTWLSADLEPLHDRFAWRRFKFKLKLLREGPVVLAARAADHLGHTQPTGPAPGNPAGYCNNAVHRVRGTILCRLI